MEEKNHFVHGVAYGKLYLAGEYAILEDYASALITSVPKKITVFVEKSDKTTIFDTINKTKVGLLEENSNFTLVPTRKISSQFYETTKGRLSKEDQNTFFSVES